MFPVILNNFYFFTEKLFFFIFLKSHLQRGLETPPTAFSQGLDPKVIILVHIWSTEYARSSGGSPQNTFFGHN